MSETNRKANPGRSPEAKMGGRKEHTHVGEKPKETVLERHKNPRPPHRGKLLSGLLEGALPHSMEGNKNRLHALIVGRTAPRVRKLPRVASGTGQQTRVELPPTVSFPHYRIGTTIKFVLVKEKIALAPPAKHSPYSLTRHPCPKNNC